MPFAGLPTEDASLPLHTHTQEFWLPKEAIQHTLPPSVTTHCLSPGHIVPFSLPPSLVCCLAKEILLSPEASQVSTPTPPVLILPGAILPTESEVLTVA